MKTTHFSCTALSALLLAALTASPRGFGAEALGTPAAVHCQVPCGIFGDKLRIDLLMEDAATIEKAMKSLAELGAEEHPNHNQLVRWVVTKDQHAQSIQEQVASYWLAQRIKAPAADADPASYHKSLALLHGITIAAMKCKQTTDPANVAALRSLALDFSGVYFTGADLEHIKSHHAAIGGGHR